MNTSGTNHMSYGDTSSEEVWSFQEWAKKDQNDFLEYLARIEEEYGFNTADWKEGGNKTCALFSEGELSAANEPEFIQETVKQNLSEVIETTVDIRGIENEEQAIWLCNRQENELYTTFENIAELIEKKRNNRWMTVGRDMLIAIQKLRFILSWESNSVEQSSHMLSEMEFEKSLGALELEVSDRSPKILKEKVDEILEWIEWQLLRIDTRKLWSRQQWYVLYLENLQRLSAYLHIFEINQNVEHVKQKSRM